VAPAIPAARPLISGALLYILEEVAQNHGQVQLTRDLLLAGS
jgi:hypothetical protein